MDFLGAALSISIYFTTLRLVSMVTVSQPPGQSFTSFLKGLLILVHNSQLRGGTLTGHSRMTNVIHIHVYLSLKTNGVLRTQ